MPGAACKSELALPLSSGKASIELPAHMACRALWAHAATLLCWRKKARTQADFVHSTVLVVCAFMYSAHQHGHFFFCLLVAFGLGSCQAFSPCIKRGSSIL